MRQFFKKFLDDGNKWQHLVTETNQYFQIEMFSVKILNSFLNNRHDNGKTRIVSKCMNYYSNTLLTTQLFFYTQSSYPKDSSLLLLMVKTLLTSGFVEMLDKRMKKSYQNCS